MPGASAPRCRFGPIAVPPAPTLLFKKTDHIIPYSPTAGVRKRRWVCGPRVNEPMDYLMGHRCAGDYLSRRMDSRSGVVCGRLFPPVSLAMQGRGNAHMERVARLCPGWLLPLAVHIRFFVCGEDSGTAVTSRLHFHFSQHPHGAFLRLVHLLFVLPS